MVILSQLRVKILLTMLAAVAVSILIFNLLLNPLLREQCMDNTRHKLGLALGSFQHSLNNYMAGRDKCDFFNIVTTVTEDSSILGMRYANSDGIIRYSHHPGEVGKSLDPSVLEMTVDHAGFYQEIVHPDDGKDYLTTTMVVANGDACQECHNPGLARLGFLNLDLSLAETQSSIALVRKYYIIFVLITVILLGLAIGLIHVQFVQKSIQGMTQTLARFEGGDLAARMTMAQEDELGDLAQSFNRMADKLQSLNQEIEQHHEEQMERVEKIATTGELAASVAHEIKNPASGIANAMQIILSELNEDDERRPIYEEIVRQVDRMNKAISDLLIYAQPSPPVLEIVDVAYMVAAALRFVEPQAQNSSVTITKKIDQNLPPILADRKQVEQVLINLYINAIQAMPEGGQMMIRCWQDSDDRRVRISVADTGPGISREKQADIFKPFYTTKAKGSGLGLAICRRIMQEHRGRIELDSEPGRGTTFTLTFPSKRGNNVTD
jgi:two-component system NtrC family sensor kinase